MHPNSWQEIRRLWRAAEERPAVHRGVVAVLRKHFHEPDIVGRMAALEDFIRQTCRRQFRWGVSDCSLMVADWCVWVGRDDPAAALRSTYSDEASCRALVAARGDLAAVMTACAVSIGLTQVREPEFGCVAVIGSPKRPERQWAAIWNGARWLVWWGNETKSQWAPFAGKPLVMWRV